MQFALGTAHGRGMQAYSGRTLKAPPKTWQKPDHYISSGVGLGALTVRTPSGREARGPVPRGAAYGRLMPRGCRRRLVSRAVSFPAPRLCRTPGSMSASAKKRSEWVARASEHRLLWLDEEEGPREQVKFNSDRFDVTVPGAERPPSGRLTGASWRKSDVAWVGGLPRQAPLRQDLYVRSGPGRRDSRSSARSWSAVI